MIESEREDSTISGLSVNRECRLKRERERERGNVHLISQVLVSKEAGVFV